MPKSLPELKFSMQINKPISLYSGPFQISSQAGMLKGRGRLVLQLLPRPALHYILHTSKKDLIEGWGHYPDRSRKADLVFPNIGLTIPEHIHDYPPIFDETQGAITGKVVFGQSTDLTTVRFRIINLPYHETPISFDFGPWLVSLVPVEHLRGLTDRLETIGGYAITHAGTLTLQNGAGFDYSEADIALRALGRLISFVAGRWAFPLLRTGMAGDKAVLCDWSMLRLLPWHRPITWAPKIKQEMYEEVATNAYRYLTDPTWEKVLQVAINWYILGLDADTVDTALLVTQVALELLANAYRIPKRGKVPYKTGKETTRNLYFSERLTMLLDTVGPKIPTAVPHKYSDVMASTHQPGLTGPELIARLRNDIAHGDIVKPDASSTPDNFSGVQLALWYLELIMLRLFKYNSLYYDRTVLIPWTGMSVELPWT